MYIPVPFAINCKGIKMNDKLTPKTEATPNIEEDEFMPCPNTPCKLEVKTKECNLLPSAQYVEKYTLITLSSPIKSSQLASTEKQLTHSTTRAEIFTVPASINISDDEQDSLYTVASKPYGLSP